MRPTKYEPRYAKDLLDFFNVEVFIESFGKKKLNRFPTFERFAVSLMVTHKTLLNWTTRHEEFLQAYEICKDIQKALLVEGGMSGDYNAAFCKFLAVNVTDLREKIEQEIQLSKIEISTDEQEL